MLSYLFLEDATNILLESGILLELEDSSGVIPPPVVTPSTAWGAGTGTRNGIPVRHGGRISLNRERAAYLLPDYERPESHPVKAERKAEQADKAAERARAKEERAKLALILDLQDRATERALAAERQLAELREARQKSERLANQKWQLFADAMSASGARIPLEQFANYRGILAQQQAQARQSVFEEAQRQHLFALQLQDDEDAMAIIMVTLASSESLH